MWKAFLVVSNFFIQTILPKAWVLCMSYKSIVKSLFSPWNTYKRLFKFHIFTYSIVSSINTSQLAEPSLKKRELIDIFAGIHSHTMRWMAEKSAFVELKKRKIWRKIVRWRGERKNLSEENLPPRTMNRNNFIPFLLSLSLLSQA